MAQSPFDINKFLAGQPVVTTNGKAIGKVKELKYKETDTAYLTAMVDGAPAIWSMTGVYVGADRGLDLKLSDPVNYGWVQPKNILHSDPKQSKYIKVIIP